MPSNSMLAKQGNGYAGFKDISVPLYWSFPSAFKPTLSLSI
jgi:hypothetical protein